MKKLHLHEEAAIYTKNSPQTLIMNEDQLRNYRWHRFGNYLVRLSHRLEVHRIWHTLPSVVIFSRGATAFVLWHSDWLIAVIPDAAETA
jgi:hypothetical protein